jgi:putative MATE family efflux protein
MALMMIGRMGSEIGTAQNLGGGDKAAARGFAEDSTRMALALGIIYGAIMLLFTGPLISLMQVKVGSDMYTAACTYLRVVAIGVPLTYVTGAITGSFNGAGNSALAFRANSVGLIANMILDPLMIITLNWGITGAAIATLIAQAIVCALFIYSAKRGKTRPFEKFQIFNKINRKRMKAIISWTLPIAIESAAFTGLAMVTTGMVSARYGDTALAVQRVGSQIESLSWLIGGGFASAVTAFVGQNFGAGKLSRIREGYKVSLRALLGWEIIITLILVFAGKFLFSLFLSGSDEMLGMAQTYMRIIAICQIFAAAEGACAGVFKGMGKTLPPSVCSISSNIARPFLCWWLSGLIGINGMWLGMAVSASLRGISIFIWYTIYDLKNRRRGENVIA